MFCQNLSFFMHKNNLMQGTFTQVMNIERSVIIQHDDSLFPTINSIYFSKFFINDPSPPSPWRATLYTHLFNQNLLILLFYMIEFLEIESRQMNMYLAGLVYQPQ